MVFESIVVDLLNRFLGNYVENLDSSQLKIGIWGGDVSLQNLSLKSTALDDLNLPIKTIYGHLGKLNLKIPWKNIYTAPVEVYVENLFLLVNPIQDVIYDPEKEEKLKQEAKQALINKVELAKKNEKEKDGPKVDDTFVEKLAAQIIKNVQVFIKDIHLRYEDRITKPGHQFSIGISLHTLKLFTTNESCDRYILPQETSPIFYKIMVMEALSVYWNINTDLFTDNEIDTKQMNDLFYAGIANKDKTTTGYRYILDPINSEAKLQINSKPEIMNFVTPKMFLSLVLEQLCINLSRSQYQDLVALLETFDRMTKGEPYRKYRPNLSSYNGHYKEWWLFAIRSVLEEEVKRKFKNWDWNAMNMHRNLCKRYQTVYRAKLVEKPTEAIKKELTELELKLDAFNIILMRQKVENEVEREGRLIAEQKASQKGSWFSGWFWSGGKEQDSETDVLKTDDIVKQFEKAMTDEERERLYRAIDYHEAAAPMMYPVTFVAIRTEFILHVLKVVIIDDYVKIDEERQENTSSHSSVLCIEFKKAFVSLCQRPAAQSFAVSIIMQSFHTLGLQQHGVIPQIVKSKLSTAVEEDSPEFLNIFFETNPLDENYDQKLYVTLRPLKIVYDAQTVIKILEVFTPEKDISTVTDQIQAAANTKLEEMKEKSALRLQYAIEKSTRLDLKVDLMAPYLIIPFGGFYTRRELALVINLGRIIVESKSKENTSYNVKKLLLDGRSETEVLKQMMLQCYDRFSICLGDVQILSLKAGENWRPPIGNVPTSFDYSAYILHPTSIYFDIYKCLVDDDPRLPKLKIDGNLPDITIRITEKKLLETVSLIISLPLPQKTLTDEEKPHLVEHDTASLYDSTLSLRHRLESFNKLQFSSLRKYRRPADTVSGEDVDESLNDVSIIDFVNLEANFSLKALTICVECEQVKDPLIEANLSNLQLTFIQRTFSSEISTKLGTISLTQTYKSSVVPAITTPISSSSDDKSYLFSCRLLIAERNSPVFEKLYDSTATLIEADFTKLYATAHQEAILYTIEWINDIQAEIMQLMSQHQHTQTVETKSAVTRRRKSSVSSNFSTCDYRRKKLRTKSALTSIVEDHLSEPSTKKRKETKTVSEITELKLKVTLNVIQVCLQTCSRPLATMDIDGLEASVSIKKSYTHINALLQSISVCDLNPDTIYNKVATITEGKEAFRIQITLCNAEHLKQDTNSFDVLVNLKMNCLQCVFINEFVMDVLEFVNNFQTSKKMIAEASAAAVASAAMNVQQVYQSSTRVSLDIFAYAPVIIIPRSNKCSEIFIADFGNLSVKNKLKSSRQESGHVVLIDEIHTRLNDMKIVRTDYKTKVAEYLVLEPVNYTLDIKRNLSASWYKDVPDFVIDGEFRPIYIRITDNDYKLLMQTLNENIGAKQSQADTTTRTTTSQPIIESISSTHNNADIIQAEFHENGKHAIKKSDNLNVMMQFAMAVDSVTVDLSYASDDTEKDNGLARFTLSFMCIKGEFMADGNFRVTALLENCCLDDTRPSKALNQVKRYMQRKTKDEMNGSMKHQWIKKCPSDERDRTSTPKKQIANFANRSMIDVSYEKENDKTQLNATVFSFLLILNMDHIMKIQEFFMSEPAPENTTSAALSESAKKHPTVQRADNSKPQSANNSFSYMDCCFVIEKPDIILVEHLDDINTNAIILNNEGKLDLRIHDTGVMLLNGVLNDITLYACCYNPEKRNQTSALILRPVTVKLNGSVLQNGGLDLDIDVSEVSVSIIPGTIELLSKISSTLISNNEADSKGTEVAQKDYSDIWEQKPIRDDYWFLKMEQGLDIAALCFDDLTNSNQMDDEKRLDKIRIKIPFVIIQLEAGIGNKSLPLLALQSSFDATMNRTNEELNLNSYVTLEVGYYNSSLALWEPLIEPIMQVYLPSTSGYVNEYIPWKLQLMVQMYNKQTDNGEKDVTDSNNEVNNSKVEQYLEQPALSICINSEQRIEVTITKTCMDVIKALSQSFNNAVSLKSASGPSSLYEVNFACLSLVNEFGVDFELHLPIDLPFRLMEDNVDESPNDDVSQTVIVKTGEAIHLYARKNKTEETEESNENGPAKTCLLETLNSTTGQQDYSLHLKIPSRDRSLVLPVFRADKRYFSVRHNNNCPTNDEFTNESWGLVSEVELIDGTIRTTLRSVVRVFNHFTIDVYVYCEKMDKNKGELYEVGKVKPLQYFDLPVQAVYNNIGKLFFAPERYNPTNEGFVWKDLQKTLTFSKQVRCYPRNCENEDPFFIRILGELEQVYYENTNTYTVASTTCNIHLRPTLIFKNFLPVNVVCCIQGIASEYDLKPGQRVNVSTAEPDYSTIVLRLDNYLDKVWSCKKIIKSDAPIFSVWTFDSYDSKKQFSLNLGVWYSNSDDSMIFALYCPFWMVNKTGLFLSYKGVEDGGMILHHPHDFEVPILFSFKEKAFFSKKKACVRVNDGEWSDKFSLDAAGSSGVVSCYHNNQIYQLGVYIRLNYNSLTKQVIFSPFYTVANHCPYNIEFRENQVKNSNWKTVNSEACIPFWPTMLDDKKKTLELRILNTHEITTSFSYLKIKTYSLMLRNEYGGIQVDVQVTEGGVYIAFKLFQPKLAAALIINNTDTSVDISEIDYHSKGSDFRNSRCDNLIAQNMRLESKKEVLFNWFSTNIDKPALILNRNSHPIDLRKDGVGELVTKTREELIEKKYWISFLHGMQRVLLITADVYVVKEIEAIGDFEKIQQEIIIGLEGIGFSLINNISKQELFYVSIASSGYVWELQKKPNKKYKPVHELLNARLEEAYEEYCKSSYDENINTEIHVQKDMRVTVNFYYFRMLRPTPGVLRRIHRHGLWLQVRSSERYKQIHAKIHRFQMDNQIYDCVFPVILSPVPIPKSVAASDNNEDSALGKPFAELSIVQRINENSSLNQFKYFKLLVQEFHIKVDINFVNGLVKFFEVDRLTDEEELEQFHIDENVTKEALCVHVSSVTSQDFYDLLHFSPLKIHISFSLCGENPNAGTPQQSLPIVNLLTQSVGVTLTDVNDVVFRLAYFERKHKFYSRGELMSEVRTHYIGQFVKQLYVLVLGLDVLGNPFGLVTGLKQGVEDFFYEPFQGAIQGPNEFAEGLLLGVRSLFGHTVGGAAGAVGRITGAMGKGIAALTLDEDYQKKRRQRLAQQQSSIAEGGRGLVMGVVEGVGGVISKPISGAREEGVEGFVKGVGKGMVGLFMRPASGAVDFASGAVDAVRRVASFSEEVRRYRLPRYLKENGLVTPYWAKDAEGYKLLMDAEKGRYAKTDNYVVHVPITDSSSDKEVLLLTDNRVLYLMKSSDIFSDNIKVEWQYTWIEVKREESVGETDEGVYIKVNSNDRTSAGSFGSIFKRSCKGKIVLISNQNLKQWLVSKMKELVRKANRL